jgi:hypothetical protein
MVDLKQQGLVATARSRPPQLAVGLAGKAAKA